jgi:chaperonin GroEL
VIRVGGSTEVEVKEKKDRVDDAMHATRRCGGGRHRSGGGVLCCAPRGGSRMTTDNPDVKAGINIVLVRSRLRSVRSPRNSGVEGSIVVGKDHDNIVDTFGFDAQSEQFVDMLQAGFVDPARWSARLCRMPPRWRDF